MTMFEHDWKAYPELTNQQLETLEILSPHPQIKEDFEAEVVKVHDGDTIMVRTSFRDFDFPLRFLNVDAPELSEGGADSRDWLSEEILGETVYIKVNKKNRVGKYGRLLGLVFYQGMDMGDLAIQFGYAVPFGKKNEAMPDPLDKTLRLDQWF